MFDKDAPHDNAPDYSKSVFEKQLGKRPLWTLNDVATFLRVSPRTVEDFVYRRAIPFRKAGRCVRFSPEEIEKWTLPFKE